MKIAAVNSVIFLSLSTVLWATPQVYFSPGGVQTHLVAAIDATSRTLDVAIYELSSKTLITALKRAGERGVLVRLLLDEKVLKEHREDKSLASIPNITLRTLSGRERKRGMMHNKFAIFDETHLVTGSYNWSQGAELANYENAIFLDDLDVVRAYSAQFADLWVRGKSVSEGSDLFSSHNRHHYH